MPLSPLLQTDEVRAGIQSALARMRYQDVYELRGGSVDHQGDIQMLQRVETLLDNPYMYMWGEFADMDNERLVAILLQTEAIADDVAQTLVRAFKQKNENLCHRLLPS